MLTYPPLPNIEPPEPLPYEGWRFRGRQDILERVDALLQEGKQGLPITRSVLHIWAPSGAGKTWLLERLYNQYCLGAPASRGPRRSTFATLINLAALRFSAHKPLTAADLAGEMVAQIRSEVGAGMEPAQREAQAFNDELAQTQREEGKREATGLAERMARLIERLADHFVPLLLFDAADVLTEDDFFWLETHVIEPIARTDRALIVVAGRRELPRWREFAVRQRLETRELPPFTEMETRQQVAEVDERLAGLVYRFSAGLPYANQVFSEALAGLAPRHGPLPPRFEEEHRNDLLRLLGYVESELLKGVRNPEHHDILRTLSALRKFNVESARYMLAQLLEESYGRKPDNYFMILFKDLEDTSLVWWSSQQRGYVIGSSLRSTMDLRIRLGAVNAYAERHLTAERLYEGFIVRRPADPAPFLAEILYHMACRWQATHPERVQAELHGYLERALEKGSWSPDGANTLMRLLAEDREHFDESMTALQPIYDELYETALDFRNKIAEFEPAEGDYDAAR